MFYGVFVDVSHGCDSDDDKELEEAHVCCSTSKTNDLQIKEECCTSDVHMYQIDTDLATNDFKVNFINNFNLTFSNSVAFIVPEYRKIPTSNKAPPVLRTLERLSLFQFYLI